MIEIELDNRSGAAADEDGHAALARAVLAAEGVHEGELGIHFVGPEESRDLKLEHLGIDEATDVLSFPMDGLDELPEGEPRALGDLVICPQVVGEAWREPLIHGLLHLLGHDHGDAMEERERAHVAVFGGDEGKARPEPPALPPRAPGGGPGA